MEELQFKTGVEGETQINEVFEDTVQKALEAEKAKKELENLSPDMKFFIEANFHRSNLLKIKRAVKDCTFLAHERYRNQYFIKAVMKNETGGKDTIRFSLGTTPDKMTDKDYQELYSHLKDSNYVAG